MHSHASMDIPSHVWLYLVTMVLCLGIPGCGWLCLLYLVMPGYAWLCLVMPGYTWLCLVISDELV